jgi:RNA polymerase sigma-70 factor, ECF subfamily
MARLTPISVVSPRSSAVLPSAEELFDAHFEYIWNSLLRLGVRRVDLEDLTHEVFVRVHAHLSAYDTRRPVRPWLFGFAYRVASEHRRLARHRLEVFGTDVEPVDTGRADDDLQRRQEIAIVEAALDSLSLDRRALIVMHEVDGVPMPVIARELGIPLNTAYSRLRLAREALAAAVEERSRPHPGGRRRA